MKKLFLMFVVILSARLSFAQTISGEIIDTRNAPVSYANVVLFQTDNKTLISGTVSDSTGKFSINISENQDINNIMIVTSFIGMINDTLYYNDVVNSSYIKIKLNPDLNLLDEITVSAYKSPIKMSGSSIIANVEHSILAKLSSLDILMNKIPFVSSKDGSMTVFGRGDAVVYLNGRQVYDKNILKQLSPNQIKSVEVITNPDSKYGSEVNAVIKITSKNNSEGWGGNIIAKSVITNQIGGSIYAKAIYTQKKWEVFASIDLLSNPPHNYDSFEKTDFLSSGYAMKSDVTNKYICEWIAPTIGVNYSLSDDSNIGVRSVSMKSYETNDFTGNLKHFTNQDIDFEDFTRNYNHAEPIISYLIFYYTKKFKNTSLDFSNNNIFGKRPQTSEYTESAAEIYQNNITKYRVNSFLLDFETKFSDIFKLTYGAELTFTNDKQDFDFSTKNIETDMFFSSSERKQALIGEYLNAKFSFEKISLDFGLRYEHTDFDYYNQEVKEKEYCRSYDDWLPSYNLRYSLNSNISFSTGYRTTIKRPRYKQLGDKITASNKYSYSRGNPFLQPYYRHSFNNMIKLYDFSIISSFENRKQYMTKDYVANDKFLISQDYNLKNFWKNTVGLEWGSEFGFYEPEIEIDYSHQYLSGTFLGKGIDYKTPIWDFSVSNSFSLPWDMFLSIDLEYSTRGHEIFDYDHETWYSCIDLSKDFDNGFSISMTYDGFLVPKNAVSKSKIDNFYFYSNETNFVRNFTVSVSYIFNNQKLKYSGNKTSSEINRLDK